MTKMTGDALDSLPQTVFVYETDELKGSFGSLKKIGYASGKIKELDYMDMDTSSSFYPKLDYAFGYSECPAREGAVFVNDNTFYFPHVKARICYYDGYWIVDSSQETNSNFYDQAGLSDDNWIAYYDRNISKIIIKKWMGGYWNTDTLADTSLAIACEGGKNVYIYPGKDCFVCIVGKLEGSVCGSSGEWKYCKRSYYFKYKNKEWHKYLINEWSNYDLVLGGVAVAGDYFIIGQWDNCLDDRTYLNYGVYDHSGDSLILEAVQDHPDTFANKVVANPNFIAYATSTIIMLKWHYGSTLHSTAVLPQDSSDEITNPWICTRVYAIAGIENGIVAQRTDWAKDYMVGYDDEYYYFHTVPIGGNIMVSRIDINITNDYLIDAIWSNRHSIVTRDDKTDDVVIWEYIGNTTQWSPVDTVENDSWDKKNAILYDDFYIWRPPDTLADSQTVKAGCYLGNGVWSDTILTVTCMDEEMNTGGNGFIVDTYQDIDSMFCRNSYYTGQHYDTCILNEDMSQGMSFIVKATGEAYYHVRYKLYKDPLYIDPDSIDVDVYAYKKSGMKMTGKPSCPVVYRVKHYSSSTDTNPICVDYKYDGGLMNQSNTLP